MDIQKKLNNMYVRPYLNSSTDFQFMGVKGRNLGAEGGLGAAEVQSYSSVQSMPILEALDKYEET
jgi:lipid A disaccharide synthetase